MYKPSFAFVYMGRRGGGNALLGSLIDDLEKEDISCRFIVSQRNESLSLYTQKKNVSFIRTDSWIQLLKDSWTEVRHNDESFIFVMQHPHDFFLWILTRILHKSRIVMIHDDKRHKGDVYPQTLGLRLRARNSTQRIFFSKYVQSQYPSKKNDFIWRYYDCINKKRFAPSKNYLLTIGRLRKYQGIDLIPQIICNLKIDFDRWVIAGNSKTLYPRANDRIQLRNDWLSEEEIDSNIASARVVVLPYIEASQSGILPRIASLGVPIVITPVGGLSEQVEKLQKCVIAEGNSELAIAKAIEAAWKMEELMDSQVNDSNRPLMTQLLVRNLKSNEC